MAARWLSLWLVLGWVWFAGGPTWGQILEEINVDDPTEEKPAPAKAPTADLEAATEMIVKRTNEFRQQHGLEPLETASRLMATAKEFAQFMARTNQYGHTAGGTQPGERAKEHGYTYCILAENIAYQYNPAGIPTEKLVEGFVAGWKNSPEHRRNMLDPHVTETGVGVAHSETSGAYFAVQLFGRPQSKRFEFQVTNRSDETVRYTVAGEDQETFTLPPRATRTHQRCRPAEVDFGWIDRRESVAPGDRARFVVVQKPGGPLELERR